MRFKITSLIVLLFLSVPVNQVLAHDGHGQDPYHLHKKVSGVEVALQIKSLTSYQAYLKAQKLPPADFKNSPEHVLLVVLTQNQKWLNTRVKLKLTDAQGAVVGDKKGLEPTVVKEKDGTHFVFPVTLKKGHPYFSMVQFQTDKGISRAAFHFKAP